MNPEEILTREYVNSKVYRSQELTPYIEEASILWTENDPGLVWDLMVFFPDDLFREFSNLHGDCFVIDDHDHIPEVFTRVKSFGWLRRDFANRLPIALWIYQHSLVLADKEGRFNEILQEQVRAFGEAIPEILRRKYLEFRTERHNLRHALQRKRTISIALIRTTVVKLGLEIAFLAEKKPYPYKKWLPWVVLYETRHGRAVLQISEEFLNTEDPTAIVELSDCLVEKIIEILSDIGIFPEDFLQRWWLYLV